MGFTTDRATAQAYFETCKGEADGVRLYAPVEQDGLERTAVERWDKTEP